MRKLRNMATTALNQTGQNDQSKKNQTLVFPTIYCIKFIFMEKMIECD